MPLHYPGSKAVQCHLCYCLFRDNTVLNKHYKNEHDTDLSQVYSAVRQPRRYKARNTYKAVKLPRKRSENITSMQNKPSSKNPYKSDKTSPEVEIKEEKEEDLPSRGSRKRKVNKTYFDECYVH